MCELSSNLPDFGLNTRPMKKTNHKYEVKSLTSEKKAIRDYEFATTTTSEFRTIRPIKVSYKSSCFINHSLVQVEIKVGGGGVFYF